MGTKKKTYKTFNERLLSGELAILTRRALNLKRETDYEYKKTFQISKGRLFFSRRDQRIMGINKDFGIQVGEGEKNGEKCFFLIIPEEKIHGETRIELKNSGESFYFNVQALFLRVGLNTRDENCVAEVEYEEKGIYSLIPKIKTGNRKINKK